MFRAISGEHLVAQRHPALGNHQTDADLFAVRAVVARVTPLGRRIGLGLALEIRAGHIVQQQVVLQPEKIAQPIFQKDLQRLLVRQQRVDAR